MRPTSVLPASPEGLISRANCLGLFGLFAVALLLRLWRLDHQSLWFDEHLTLEGAGHPLDRLFDWLPGAESNKPPLYFVVMHWVAAAFPGDYWLRLPSAIFGAATCTLSVVVAFRLLGERWGWAVGVLHTFAPMHVFYSQEARMYTLWGLFVTGAMYWTLAYCQDLRPRSLVGYGIFAVLGCYTFTYGMFVVGFSLLFGIVFRPSLSRREFGRLVAVNALVILSFTPWIVRIASSAASGIGLQATQRGSAVEAAAYTLFCLGFGSTLGPPLETLQLHGRGVFQEHPVQAGVLLGGFFLLAVLLLLGCKRGWKSNRNLVYFSVAGLAAFWLTPAVVSALTSGVPYNPRYAFPAIMPCLLLFILASQSIVEHRWLLFVLGLFIAGVFSSLFNYFLVPAYGRDNMRAAADFVSNLKPQPDHVVICAGHLENLFRHYYHGTVPIKAVLRVQAEPSEDSLESIGRFFAADRQFVLVYSRPDHGDPSRSLPRFLEERYPLRAHKHWTGVEMLLFQREQQEH